MWQQYVPTVEYESAFQYLAEHTEIRDVILSGGDPMMLSDSRLEYIHPSELTRRGGGARPAGRSLGDRRTARLTITI